MSVDSKVDFADLTTIKEFCKALVKGGNIKTQEDLYGKDGIIKQLQKGFYEALLEGELDHHLGYDKHEDSTGDNYRNGYSEKTIKTQQGTINIDIPRDRKGSFDPVIIAKHQKRAAIIDETIIGLYSKGMSLSQIKEQIQEVYQLELSEDQISKITDSVMEDVAKWAHTPIS
jgi:putative transposase